MYTEKDGWGGVATLSTGQTSVLWRAPRQLVTTGGMGLIHGLPEHPLHFSVLQPGLTESLNPSTVEWGNILSQGLFAAINRGTAYKRLCSP